MRCVWATEIKERIVRYEKKMEECDNFSASGAKTDWVRTKRSCSVESMKYETIDNLDLCSRSSAG
jgi:hypothetical protein